MTHSVWIGYIIYPFARCVFEQSIEYPANITLAARRMRCMLDILTSLYLLVMGMLLPAFRLLKYNTR